ncbi:hypothetical protein [Streptomyces sp. NPDC021020]|uniref:hypothetical protein n=1 Tax=Streptomyces sp. NPDC021020 TaxID=3365109 RepID=UPI0037AEBBF4
MTPRRPHEDHALDEVLASLRSAVKGGRDAGVLSPRVLPAFDADCRPVSLGDGLWGVARTSVDGATRALCVHNLTDGPATFAVGALLPPVRPDDQLHFVRGEARTSATADGDIAIHLDRRSFVWLARFPDAS